jgi:uncharacterized protein YkwD
MLSNDISLIYRILIWVYLCSPLFATAEESVTGDIGTPIFETGTSAEALHFIQPLNAQPVFFEHGDPTRHEQYMLELINRARANPAAEAVRLEIDLNQGLNPGTITNTPKPPLAFHPQLISAARAHSQWMLDTDIFSHTGSGGSSPGDRMTQAGYPFTGSWSWGENIGWRGTTGTSDITAFTALMHDGLFLSPDHRANLMKDQFDEVGIGLLDGSFEQFNALMGTQNFALSGGTPGPLLTGVVYDDLNGNRFYDVGEGVAGVNVDLTGGAYYTVTSRSGGFALPYGNGGAGKIELIFSGGGLQTSFRTTFIGTGQNVKQDLVVTDQPALLTLTISKAGTGSGSVNGPGIHCGSDCTETYVSGTSLTLTATPAHGSTFTGWSGACAGMSACAVTLDAAKTVTATFTPVATGFQTAAQTISWFYAAAFSRTPIPNSALPNYGDIGGLAFWTQTYLTGEGALAAYRGNVYAIADFFVGSAEFQAQYSASLTNAQFVTALYHNMLSREPDAVGLAYWAGRLDNGESRGTVLADFTNSEENRNANRLRRTALESFIAFIDADGDQVMTPEEAAVWLTEHPDLDGAVVD